MRRNASLLIAFALAGCATIQRPSAVDAREAAALARAIDGKVADPPVSCVSINRGDGPRAISETTLIYRVNRNLVYRNELIGRCSGLSRGSALVLTVYGGQYCRGDIARAVDMFTGIWTGSCALGDFIPYRKPGTPAP